jgi:protein CpxP
MNKVLLGTLVSAAFAAAAPLALAETSDVNGDAAVVVAQAGQQPSANAPRAQRQSPDGRKFVAPSERVEARLAYARTALKITDAQQPQWDSFANVLRNHARAMDQRSQQRRAQWEASRAQGAESSQPQPRSVTAIERLERSQQRTAERSARLTEVIAAAKPLYAALSPEQKQIADGMLARQGSGGRHHQHRGMHRGA